MRARTDVAGRERELEAGRRFIAAAEEGAAALVFAGESGIGKTAVWRRVADEAEAAGCRLLASRCVEAEMPLAFAALGDLLEPVVDEAAGELPAPQRRAIDVALRRAEAERAGPDRLTVSRAVLGVLRVLSADRRLVVAVDDAHWLDPASARVLSFALRRLNSERVGLLVTERTHAGAFSLAGSLPEERVDRIELGPLSVGALAHLLRQRVAAPLPRRTVVRLHASCGGNPMFALEFARALAADGDLGRADAVPMPASLRHLVGERLAALPAELRPVLELVAALGQPTRELLDRVGADGGSLEGAIAAHALMEGDDGRVRFSHPLLASAVYADLGPARRHELHRVASEAVGDEEERARHRALASERPAEDVAALLDRAAERAYRRGAPDAAAELAEWAERLTPPERRSDRDRRVIRAAAYLVEAGDDAAAGALLEQLLADGPEKPIRVEGLLVAADAAWNDRPRLLALLRQALDCAGDDARLRCETLTRYAWEWGHRAGDEYSAERWAREAVELAEQVGDPGLCEQARVRLLEILSFRGVPPAETELMPPAPRATIRLLPGSLTRREVIGRQLLWLGMLDKARALLDEELEEASRQGSEIRVAILHQMLSEVELRAGNWGLARDYVERGLAVMREVGGNGEMFVRFGRARLAAHEGRVEEARADLAAALRRAESQEDAPNVRRIRITHGFLELSLGDYQRAWRALEGLAEQSEKMGICEPAAPPLLPDAVEALVALGRLDEAEPLVARLEERARIAGHLWAPHAAGRARGLLLLGLGELQAAIQAFESSAAGFDRIGFPFERCRSLLGAGTARRRAGERRRAAVRLEEAQAIFERLGARLWRQRAVAELRHAGARPRRDSELTTAEARVARRVASGATNKEVAAQLFTTVATVEAHLTRIYRKLELRSRADLARRVADGSLVLPDVEAGSRCRGFPDAT